MNTVLMYYRRPLEFCKERCKISSIDENKMSIVCNFLYKAELDNYLLLNMLGFIQR